MPSRPNRLARRIASLERVLPRPHVPWDAAYADTVVPAMLAEQWRAQLNGRQLSGDHLSLADRRLWNRYCEESRHQGDHPIVSERAMKFLTVDELRRLRDMWRDEIRRTAEHSP